MPSSKTTKLETIADLACRYSKAFILKGFTQLENNTYHQSQRRALYQAVMGLRDLCGKRPNFSSEINVKYQQFHRTIEICKKLSLGNCYEMALMALDYVLRFAPPSVYAEVYLIEGGDHVFLVLGREKNSTASKPETWGKEAYICDPWSDRIYPASEYLTQTKAYRFSPKLSGDYSNHLENFNTYWHKLSPAPFLNTDYLRKADSRPHLDKIIALFQKRMQAVLKALATLETKLGDVMQRLVEKYPDDPQKKIIIGKKMDQLHTIIDKITADIRENYTSLSYDVLRSRLECYSKKCVSSFQKAVKISGADKTILMKYNNEQSCATKILRFFRIKPKTLRDTCAAVDEANQSIRRID